MKHNSDMTPDGLAELQALAELPDEEIDTADIPELLDWSDAHRGAFYRPVKRQITIRLDSDLVAWFKNRAMDRRGYQTDINKALREHVQRVDAMSLAQKSPGRGSQT